MLCPYDSRRGVQRGAEPLCRESEVRQVRISTPPALSRYPLFGKEGVRGSSEHRGLKVQMIQAYGDNSC